LVLFLIQQQECLEPLSRPSYRELGQTSNREEQQFVVLVEVTVAFVVVVGGDVVVAVAVVIEVVASVMATLTSLPVNLSLGV